MEKYLKSRLWKIMILLQNRLKPKTKVVARFSIACCSGPVI